MEVVWPVKREGEREGRRIEMRNMKEEWEKS